MKTLAVYKRKLHAFSTRLSSRLEPAKWRSGNSELYEHVMNYMQTVMHALCRHVPKVIYKQTQIFFASKHAATFHKKRSACDLL